MIEAPKATPKNLRAFGLTAAAILAFFSFLAWRKGSGAFPYFLGAGSLMALAGLLLPGVLKPVFKVWMKFAGGMAVVNTFLLLGIVYYILITPYALLKRLMGNDPLELEYDKDASTYWKERASVEDPKAYERQF